jgi:hypothetical protein
MDIWVVDDDFDAVITYASGRTLVAPAPVAQTPLPAGNTSPQGIADPPPSWTGDAPTVEYSMADIQAAGHDFASGGNVPGLRPESVAMPVDTAALVSSDVGRVSSRVGAYRSRAAEPVHSGARCVAVSEQFTAAAPVEPESAEPASALDLYFTLLPQLLLS